jgi:hypothetical protein
MSAGWGVVLLVLGVVVTALMLTVGGKRWDVARATTTFDAGAVGAANAHDLMRMDSDKG